MEVHLADDKYVSKTNTSLELLTREQSTDPTLFKTVGTWGFPMDKASDSRWLSNQKIHNPLKRPQDPRRSMIPRCVEIFGMKSTAADWRREQLEQIDFENEEARAKILRLSYWVPNHSIVKHGLCQQPKMKSCCKTGTRRGIDIWFWTVIVNSCLE